MTDDTLTPALAEPFSPEEQAYEDSRGTSDEPKAEQPKTEEAKPEAAAEEPRAEEKEPEVEKLVKHGAFEEERQRRKKAQQELQVERENAARLRGQLDAIERLKAGKEPETPEQQAVELDIEKDPIGSLKALKAKLDAQEQQSRQSEEHRAEIQRISSIGTRHAEKFAANQPHFFDTKDAEGKSVQGAYTFMRAAAAAKLQAQYPDAPQAQIIAAVDLTERNHIEECMRNGDNAAERLWELAVEQGFKAPAPAAPRNANGQFAKPEPTEAERIAKLEAAQKSSKSLGSIPSGGADGPLTLEALADLPDDEFAEATKGNKWEKLHKRG